MKTLVESLFDTDLVSKETGYEYLYGLVKYIDYISSPQWEFPDWIKNYVTRVEKNMINTFRLDAIRNDYKKIIRKFDLQDWTEYMADPNKGYSHAVVQKDPYKDLIRQLIYIIVCTIETSKVMDFNTGWIDNNKLKREIDGILKKYTRIHSTIDVISDVRDDIRMYQISYDVDFPEVRSSSYFEGNYCFFKIAFKNLNGTNESLFDTDLVQKEPSGYRIKNDAYFDGQWVYRLRYNSIGIKGRNCLEVIDWRKAKTDLKKYHGEDIDLGLYAYANSSSENIKTLETDKKTEPFAKLIMSIPLVEECRWGEFNSRFRDELEEKLNEYIVDKWKGTFKFYVVTSKYTLYVSVKTDEYPHHDMLRWEFAKYSR